MTAFVSTAITGAAVANVAAVISQPALAAPDDSALEKLEEQIFEQYWGAKAYDDEINRLHPIWVEEAGRLADEVYAGRSTLTADERWALVVEMPEAIECDRLQALQSAHFGKVDEIIAQMFATPARTSEGRRAKVMVLLTCIMGSDWTGVDEETDYPERMARNLLIEFIGGEPGEMLRGQFV
jgi:hypothetical protein